MKRKIQRIRLWIFMSMALSGLMTACTLHEEPELTASGEVGVNPTEVTVEANLVLNLNLPERGNDADAGAPTVMANADYMHRFIVEAYLNRQPVARQVFVENITERTHLSLPVSMKLHASRYQLVVWSDYVSAETPEEDLYYDTNSLVPVIPNRASHTGNTEYKDVFSGTVPLDLTSYENQWGAAVELDVELSRPVARYELVATDVTDFLQRVAAGKVTGTSFTARIKYSGYVAVGYNALDGVPKHSLMYMQYNTRFNLPAEGTEEMRVGFDYVFVTSGEAVSVPLEVEIVDADNVRVANTVLQVTCESGKNTVLRGKFLTDNEEGGENPGGSDDEDGGIGFDPDYEGEIDIDIPMN